MITCREIDITAPLTSEQETALHMLVDMPESADDDFPELTAEQLSGFKKISDENRKSRCKQTVTLRLSPRAMSCAKSLGKGYTSVLSRILESALKDPAIIREYL